MILGLRATHASARLQVMSGKAKPGARKPGRGKTPLPGRMRGALPGGSAGAAGRGVVGPARARTVLLSGGNPQIAKGEGDGPVQAWIAAAPGWKGVLAGKLDALITRTVPGVRKAVKWNSPFYGIEGQGWFLSMHAFTRYVKVGFFKGIALKPPPPGCTPKSGESRWLDIHDGDALDERQFAAWVKQAALIPGWMA